MTNQPQRDLFIGRTIAGTYLVTQRIGAGGMGFVYKAVNTKLNQTVALKFITNPEGPNVAKRFAQEAKALAALTHPNIVSVKSLNIDEPGECFMVMEYLQGKDLGAILSENGPLSKDEFKTIFAQVVAGLSYAHSQGIVHRDLKPTNVMVISNSDGTKTAKILDFGLAKIMGSTQTQALTSTGSIFGTPHYMSPEQCSGKKADERSDIYALACVMHQMLSGKTPFDGDSQLQILYKHSHETLPPLEGEGLSAWSTILQKATAVDPKGRFAKVDDLWRAIESDVPVQVAARRGLASLVFPGCIVRFPIPITTIVILGLAVAVTYVVTNSTHTVTIDEEVQQLETLAKDGEWAKAINYLHSLEEEPRLNAALARSLRDKCATWYESQTDPVMKQSYLDLMIDFGKLVVDKARADARERETAADTLNLIQKMYRYKTMTRMLEVLDHEMKFTQAYDSPEHSINLYMMHAAFVEKTNPDRAAADYQIAMTSAQDLLKGKPSTSAVNVLTRCVAKLAPYYLSHKDYENVMTSVTDWMRLTDLTSEDVSVSPAEKPSAETKAQMELYLAKAYRGVKDDADAVAHFKEAKSIATSSLSETKNEQRLAILRAQIKDADEGLAQH